MFFRAIKLEKVVLEQVANVLSNPGRIIQEARRLNGAVQSSHELEPVKKELRSIEAQQRRLVKLYTAGSLPEDVLGEDSERLRVQRERLERELRQLETAKPRQIDINRLERALPRILDHLRAWVNDASEDDVTLMLNALQVQIKASNEEVHIGEGVIPVSEPQNLDQEDQDLLTTGRTSA